uniref:Tachykinin precursor 4 n=1 Tax=Capra hircus TaxID=9925 RepID=A0A8C2SE27_CAPHI
MLLCVTLLLLLGLSACTVAGDKKLAVDAEVGSWVAVTLETVRERAFHSPSCIPYMLSSCVHQALHQEDVIPSILLQLRDMKKGKASQFFGLMGKQVGGRPPIQSEATGYQREPLVQGQGGATTEGKEDENHGSE